MSRATTKGEGCDARVTGRKLRGKHSHDEGAASFVGARKSLGQGSPRVQENLADDKSGKFNILI